MQRYHKSVYFPHTSHLKALNGHLNVLKWTYSKHALDNLKYRIMDLNDVLLHIKNIQLDYKDIFEYYKSDCIEKLCYRIKYNSKIDIILVLSKDKNIITIYLNNANDLHYTLKTELYVKENHHARG